ncbi:MAG: XRE family transcriptional regulator [bacterium]
MTSTFWKQQRGVRVMAKAFSTLKNKMSSDSRARAERRTQEMLLEMNLQELRQRIAQLSQQEIADILEVTQAHVSKLERRGDMLVSRLMALVHALGGELEIHAKIQGKDVLINQFDELENLLSKKASGAE